METNETKVVEESVKKPTPVSVPMENIWIDRYVKTNTYKKSYIRGPKFYKDDTIQKIRSRAQVDYDNITDEEHGEENLDKLMTRLIDFAYNYATEHLSLTGYDIREMYPRIIDHIRPKFLKFIVKDFKESLNAYTSAFKEDKLYGLYDDDAHHPNVTLHVTHNDIDAYGCECIVRLMNALRYGSDDKKRKQYWLDITVHSDASSSEEYLTTAVVYYLYLFEGKEPGRLVISDINIGKACLDSVMVFLDPPKLRSPFYRYHYQDILSTHEMEFLYVDHHPTNKMIPNMDMEIFDRYSPFVFVATDIGGYYERLGRITDVTYEDVKEYYELTSLDAVPVVPDVYLYIYNVATNRVGKDIKFIDEDYGLDPEDPNLKLSAALIMWMIYRETFMNLPLWCPGWLSETAEHVSVIHDDLIRALDTTIMNISFWDTFEWRDHPNLAPDRTMTLAYAQCAETKESNTTYETLMGFVNKMAYYPMKPGFADLLRTKAGNPTLYPNEIALAVTNGITVVSLECRYMVSHCVTYRTESILRTAITAGAPSEYMNGETLENTIKMNMDLIDEYGGYPEYTIITYFPHIGNASLITHFVMDTLKEMNTLDGDFMVALISTDTSEVSLRSQSDKPVNGIAVVFNGGGHKQAAGCRSDALSSTLELCYKERITKK